MYGTSEELAELLAKLVVAVAGTECKCDFDSKQSVLFYHLEQKRQILLFDIQRFHQKSVSPIVYIVDNLVSTLAQFWPLFTEGSI